MNLDEGWIVLFFIYITAEMRQRHLAAIMCTDIVGYAALMGKRYQDAIAEFELGKDPQLPLSYTWLGCMYGINGEKEKARMILKG